LQNKSERTPPGRESWDPQLPPRATKANNGAAEANNFHLPTVDLSTAQEWMNPLII
jgi:hypothetical protein